MTNGGKLACGLEIEIMKVELFLSTCNSRIYCRRCLATSIRTREQCGRPALKASATQKCQFHGGRSTGPKSAAARSHISCLKKKTGDETQIKRKERAEKKLLLRYLEDSLKVLGLIPNVKTRGPKPKGYKELKTFAGVHAFLTKSRTVPAA